MDEIPAFSNLKNFQNYPSLPESIQEFLQYAYSENKEKKISKATYELLQKEYDRLSGVFQAGLFGKKREFGSLEDLLQSIGPKWILNIVLMIFASDLKSNGVDDKFDYHEFKRENLIAAYCSLQLCIEYGISHPEEFFLLSYFSDISLMLIARSQPDEFNKIYKEYITGLVQSIDSHNNLVGLVPEYSAWFLSNWKIPERYLTLLHFNKSSTNNERISLDINQKIIRFSRITAKYLIKKERFIKYSQFEIFYKTYFAKKSKDFQIFLIQLIRTLNKQAVFFDYEDISELRIFGVLKEHIDVVNKDLFTFEDLVNEVLKANKYISKQKKEIRLLRDRIENGEVRDAITGLFNHTYLQEFLQQKIREAIRYEYPITLILFDLDHFHRFNKSQGYAAGNEILRQMAKLIRENLRQSDVLARFGNDEFAVVLPYTGLPHSKIVAEKINGLISSKEFSDRINRKSHKITISMGYASVLPDKTFLDKDKLVPLALMALNKAKEDGGNNINLAQA